MMSEIMDICLLGEWRGELLVEMFWRKGTLANTELSNHITLSDAN